MLPMIYMNYNEIKEILKREVDICIKYWEDVENNVCHTQEEIWYHEEVSFDFNYILVKDGKYYSDFPYEDFDETSKFIYDTIMNNADNKDVLLLYFKDVIYCNDFEFISTCEMEDRDDIFTTLIDYFNKRFNTELKCFDED